VVVVGVTWSAFPLVTVSLPGVITPVPPVKTAVKLTVAPAVIDEWSAVKLTMVGAGYTVTVACCAIAVPAGGVTVSV
jgi:hypothetical protein